MVLIYDALHAVSPVDAKQQDRSNTHGNLQNSVPEPAFPLGKLVVSGVCYSGVALTQESGVE